MHAVWEIRSARQQVAGALLYDVIENTELIKGPASIKKSIAIATSAMQCFLEPAEPGTFSNSLPPSSTAVIP